MPDSYIEKILRARVYDVAVETPLQPARLLTERLGNRVLLKREGLQPVFSFKIRGAYNKLVNLSEADRKRGVIAASAGNHAQGVAMAATRLGIKATIVMPRTTPAIKVDAVRRFGGKAVLHGDTYDAAHEMARKLEQEKGYCFIHPYDDPEVIAGQGTVGMEILRQCDEPPDAIFVPVGGGGLIAGVAAYVKYLYPKVKIIGVEPEDAACLHAALARGRRIKLRDVGIFADGVAVRQVGVEPFKVARKRVDGVITVTTDEICAAIKDIFEDTRAIAEPAGALAVAGLKRYVQQTGVRDQLLVAIDSGSNVNFDRLRHVTERSEVGEGREALLAVTIPERPGSFLSFCKALGHRNITEFNYRYFDKADAQVFVGVQLENDGVVDKEALIAELANAEYPVVDLSADELAKVHVRYMVGGHAPGVDNEVLYRFEFPERPGALLNFLGRIGGRWNISLFHYRNHGAAYGRVLVGIQIPRAERSDFRRFLDTIGYAWRDETDNSAYRLFLSSSRHYAD